MDKTVVLVLGAVALGLIWYLWLRRARRPPTLPVGTILEHVSLQTQPLLTPAEAAFYNVLQLAVQEHYLVFARVPISCLITVKAKDPGDVRLAALLARKLSRTHVDFALVHPGTLDVTQVVELDRSSEGEGEAQTRNGVTDQVLRTAGIKLVRLNRDQPYTAPALATLLGVEPPE